MILQLHVNLFFHIVPMSWRRDYWIYWKSIYICYITRNWIHKNKCNLLSDIFYPILDILIEIHFLSYIFLVFIFLLHHTFFKSLNYSEKWHTIFYNIWKKPLIRIIVVFNNPRHALLNESTWIPLFFAEELWAFVFVVKVRKGFWIHICFCRKWILVLRYNQTGIMQRSR